MLSFLSSLFLLFSLSFVSALPFYPDLYQIRLLAAHNAIRAEHGANPLRWSYPLALMASKWADSCMFENTSGALSSEPYGENIAAGTGDFTPDAAVALFIQDESQYDPQHASYNHYTQVVWKSTTTLGCAVAVCDNIFPNTTKATYYVCLYDPPGNVIGQAPENVPG